MKTYEEEFEQVEDLLYWWFKNVKGYDDWTDDQIAGSLNIDDFNEFKQWFVENTNRLTKKYINGEANEKEN